MTSLIPLPLNPGFDHQHAAVVDADAERVDAFLRMMLVEQLQKRRQRHDHIAVSMIVDTAHIVVSRALTECDHDIAREAAEIALKAAPHDDIPHLDFARVLTATGHQGLAEKELDDHIYNRDDGDGPVEPPARSKRAAG